MSLTDDAAALRNMASQVPTAQVRQMQQDILELCVNIRGILGSNLESANQNIVDKTNRLGIRLESAAVACSDLEYAINQIADGFEQIGG
jgi:hypothetical protein